MKKFALLAIAVGAVVMTSCKSKEDMYRKMYEDAKSQQTAVEQNKAVVVTPAQTTTTVVTPAQTAPVTPVDLSGTRQIQGEITVVSGEQLKEFSVVVGSFQTQANAEGLKTLLQQKPSAWAATSRSRSSSASSWVKASRRLKPTLLLKLQAW